MKDVPRHSADTEQLNKALASALQLAQGQDEQLDTLLVKASRQLAEGDVNPIVLAQLEKAVVYRQAARRELLEKQLRGFNACVAQLLKVGVPESVGKELATFIRSARKQINIPGESELLPLRFAKVQDQALGSIVSDRSALSVDEEAIADIEALVESDSLDELPPYSSISEAIEDILKKMMTEMVVPEQAKDYWSNANDLLQNGLNWYELAAFLEQLSLIFQVSAQTENAQVEQFLQDITERLQTIHGNVASVDGSMQAIQLCGDSLEEDIRKDISSITSDVKSAESIDGLKSSVLQSMDVLVGQLDTFHDERDQLQHSYQSEINNLTRRVDELERNSLGLQAELNQHKLQSERDQLTGLPNRFVYERVLSNELERWERYGNAFCLAVADIDFFKRVNDQYGHLAGDKVLIVIAKMIRQQLRRVDFVARYGGEEFVLILPETELDNAVIALNKIVTVVRESPFHYDQQPLKVTLSFGVTQVAETDTGSTLFERADAALYLAKANGRDRIETAPSGPNSDLQAV